jgi:hypothetical protein
MTILIGIDDQIVEATEEISAKIKADQDAYAKNEARIKAEAKAKETARQVILDRLGLTADEAAILLG